LNRLLKKQASEASSSSSRTTLTPNPEEKFYDALLRKKARPDMKSSLPIIKAWNHEKRSRDRLSPTDRVQLRSTLVLKTRWDKKTLGPSLIVFWKWLEISQKLWKCENTTLKKTMENYLNVFSFN